MEVRIDPARPRTGKCAAMSPALISLIVPTRQRPELLRRLLGSLADTTAQPEALEIVLVVDADDPTSLSIAEPRLPLRHVIVPSGQTMGNLNMAGYEAARGRYLMLLNDDVVARTPGWDDAARSCFAAFADDMLLLHVNDLVMQKHLCTFPIVSRSFCELAGGICPREFVRYRIDDHIEDCFNLLGVLGERRIVYAPDIVFEHANYVENAAGLRQYFSDPDILGVDAPRFERLLEQRKATALRMKARICGRADVSARWRRRLARVHDSMLLRTPNRQKFLTPEGIVEPWDLEPSLWERIRNCAKSKGWRGLAAAMRRRLLSRV